MQVIFQIYLPKPDSLMSYKEWLAMELEQRYGRTLCTKILEFENDNYMFKFETSTKPGFEDSALYDMRRYFRSCGEIYMINCSPSDGPSPPSFKKEFFPVDPPKTTTELEQTALWTGFPPK